ncbi:hypothetical protein GCM10029992_66680 [Glycomyces albus]
MSRLNAEASLVRLKTVIGGDAVAEAAEAYGPRAAAAVRSQRAYAADGWNSLDPVRLGDSRRHQSLVRRSGPTHSTLRSGTGTQPARPQFSSEHPDED